MELDPREADDRETARIVKSAVTPRPIGWISTTGENGVDNLAPYSSYNYISSAEPAILFNSPHGDGDRSALKDTARNAIETEEFVVNVVTEEVAERMDHTSASLPPEESEFDVAEVERAPSTRVAPPRVADAVVSMECTLHDWLHVNDRITIVGDVEHFHVAEAVTTDGEIDMTKVNTVGRLGGPYYTGVELLELERQH